MSRRRALIAWGGWPGHQPEQGARIVAEMLENEGFDTVVTPDAAALGSPDILTMDLAIPMFTEGAIEKADAAALVAAVRDGLGLAGYHGAIACSFPNSRAFNYLGGVQFVAHPGNIIDFTVEITRPDDPIVAGIGDFAYRSEQYYLHYDPSVDVLATTTFSGEHDPASAGVVMPVVLKRAFGEGRVFYTALGHVVAEFETPQMREILRRGLLWAARRRAG